MMMCIIVVVADSDVTLSKQLTLVPFRPLLTGLMVILDISGKLSRVESLEKVNTMVELIIRGCESTPVEPPDDTDFVKFVATPLSETTMNFHVCNHPDVLHVSSRSSPAWQTGATPEGEISTTPVAQK